MKPLIPIILTILSFYVNAQNKKHSLARIFQQMERLGYVESPDSILKSYGLNYSYKEFKNTSLTHEKDHSNYATIIKLIQYTGSDMAWEIGGNLMYCIAESPLTSLEKTYLFHLGEKENNYLSEALNHRNTLDKNWFKNALDTIGKNSIINNFHDYNWHKNFIKKHTQFMLDSTINRNKVSFNYELIFDPKLPLLIIDSIYYTEFPIAIDTCDSNKYNAPHSYFRKRALLKVENGYCKVALDDLKHVRKLRGNQNSYFWKLYYKAAKCLNDSTEQIKALTKGIDIIDSWADSIFKNDFPLSYKRVKKETQTVFKKTNIPKLPKFNHGFNFQINSHIRGKKSQIEFGPGYYFSKSNLFPDLTFNTNFIKDYGSNMNGLSFCSKLNFLIQLEYSRVLLFSDKPLNHHRTSIGFGLGYLSLNYVHNFVPKNNESGTLKSMFGITINLPLPPPKI